MRADRIRTAGNSVAGRVAPFLVLAVFAASALGAMKTWKTGNALTATDLNANFKDLDDRLKAVELARPMARHGSAVYSLDAIFCGATTPTLGNLGGHSGAKNMCEFTCSSPSAHMCTVAELQRSHALGKKATVNGWVNNTFGRDNSWGGPMRDCLGWTDSTTNAPGSLGTHWLVSSGTGFAELAPCYSSPTPVLCCD